MPSKYNPQPIGFLVMNDEYILNNLSHYNKNTYFLQSSDINYGNEYGGVIYPSMNQKTTNITKDKLPNFKFLSNDDKKVIINVSLYYYDLRLTDYDIIKKAAEILNSYATKGYNKDDIAIVMNEINLMNVTKNQLVVNTTRIFTSETLVAKGTHRLDKDFRIEKDIKLEGATLSYVSNGSQSTIKLKLDFSSNVVDNFAIDFESGAFFRGKWGGIKYSVKK